MKPYRLINALELKQLAQDILMITSEWNEEYAWTPCVSSLSLPEKEFKPQAAYHLTAGQELLAVIETDFQSVFKPCLFADESSCFDAVTEHLFLVLCKRLLATEELTLSPSTKTIDEWLYPGSTCLVLSLAVAQRQCRLIINPQWVYQRLPQATPAKASLVSLDEALAHQSVTLQVMLESLTLPLKQILNLQPGDVIACDHGLDTPLKLMQGQQHIAQAELGKTADHKSIILKRSS